MAGNLKCVRKRNGELEPMDLQQILERLDDMCGDDLPEVNKADVGRDTIADLSNEMATHEIDRAMANIAAQKIMHSPQYNELAGRILESDLTKRTPASFHEFLTKATSLGVVDPSLLALHEAEHETIAMALAEQQWCGLKYKGLCVLEKSYLLRHPLTRALLENPKFMYMRISLGLVTRATTMQSKTSAEQVEEALRLFRLLSTGKLSLATPMMFNSGTPSQTLASCFLFDLPDSLPGILKVFRDTGLCCKGAGGIGINATRIRMAGASIDSTNGVSNGIVPLLQFFQQQLRYIDQGGGKRKGSATIYLEPWHAEVEDFLDLRVKHGNMSRRALHLTTALFMNDLFLERARTGGTWSLFCPSQAVDLVDTYGDEFKELYERYENTPGLATKTMPAIELLEHIASACAETGTPYIVNKDSANRMSMQSNIGMLHSSNLCTEILEHTSAGEIAVCNLATVVLPKCIVDGVFNFEVFRDRVRVATRALNLAIDSMSYVVEETERSNLNNRPIGLGVQGMADTFNILGMPFGSPESRELNARIFEHMYFAALQESCALAKIHGPYPTYRAGSRIKRLDKQDGEELSALMHQHFPGEESHAVSREGTPPKLLHMARYYNADTLFADGSVQVSWGDSPYSQGILHMDLFDAERGRRGFAADAPEGSAPPMPMRTTLVDEWAALREEIKAHGVRNSLLVAQAPTATTSNILGNNDCFEPYAHNMTVRRLLSGKFLDVNPQMVRVLKDRGFLTPRLQEQLKATSWSLDNIPRIPDDLKALFATAKSIPVRTILEMATDRARFIDQTQSLNLQFSENKTGKDGKPVSLSKQVSQAIMFGNMQGLKTGMYYCRTGGSTTAIDYTSPAAKPSGAVLDTPPDPSPDPSPQRDPNTANNASPATRPSNTGMACPLRRPRNKDGEGNEQDDEQGNEQEECVHCSA